MTSSEIRNSAGERIDVSYHPGQKLGSLVILGHGVTGNKDRPLLVAVAKGLAERGWACLRISYPGNGASEGSFGDSCISKEVADLQSIINDVPQELNIAYIGHSMGGAVGVMTASRDARIRVLVSLAGMTHTADFVQREFGDVTPGQGNMWEEPEHPLSETFWNDLTSIGSTLDAAARVIQPWLLVHGDADDVVPIRDGEDAYAAATCVKEWLPIAGAGHVFDESSYPVIVEATDSWLKKHLG
ncbi:MAG: alpha/beta fold hydrolase [Verrucomicrobiaceae bacterium]|nr:MAG: alpha/beta fold hydrolase [Verrucomicrobiaceae bacterium]